MGIYIILAIMIGNIWFLHINWTEQRKINEKIDKLINYDADKPTTDSNNNS